MPVKVSIIVPVDSESVAYFFPTVKPTARPMISASSAPTAILMMRILRDRFCDVNHRPRPPAGSHVLFVLDDGSLSFVRLVWPEPEVVSSESMAAVAVGTGLRFGTVPHESCAGCATGALFSEVMSEVCDLVFASLIGVGEC